MWVLGLASKIYDFFCTFHAEEGLPSEDYLQKEKTSLAMLATGKKHAEKGEKR